MSERLPDRMHEGATAMVVRARQPYPARYPRTRFCQPAGLPVMSELIPDRVRDAATAVIFLIRLPASWTMCEIAGLPARKDSGDV